MTTLERSDPPSARRTGVASALIATLSLLAAAGGGWMLADPLGWYFAVPGVAEHGPFNGHFVRDIGIGYVTLAVMLGLAARRADRRRDLLWLATLWLGAHTGLHGLEADLGPSVLAGVVLPAVLTAGLAVTAKR